MWLLKLITFVLPWVAIPGIANPYQDAKEFCLVAGLWTLIFWTLFREPIIAPTPKNRWIGWCGLSVLASGLYHFYWLFINRSPNQSTLIYNSYTWIPTLNVVACLLAVFVMAKVYLRHEITLIALTQWLCISGALAAAYAILQALGLDQWYVQTSTEQSYQRPIGSFGNPEYLGLYLALISPLCLLFKAKRYLAYLGLMIVALSLTQHPGSWVVAGISVAASIFSRWWDRLHRWKGLGRWLIGLGLLAALALIVQHMLRDELRVQLWQQAWGFISVPTNGLRQVVPSFTGYGLGAFALLMKKSTTIWVHNEWLQGLIELGVLGVVCWGMALLTSTRSFWKYAKVSLIDSGWFGVWMGWLAASVVFPIAHWPHLVWIGLCAWAVVEREQEGAAQWAKS